MHIKLPDTVPDITHSGLKSDLISTQILCVHGPPFPWWIFISSVWLLKERSLLFFRFFFFFNLVAYLGQVGNLSNVIR